MMVKDIVNGIIKYVGVDLDPEYPTKCFTETLDTFLGGYKIKIDEIFANKMDNKFLKYSPITIKNIDLTSMCEHHFLPFFGYVTISYIPNKYIAGIGDFTILVNALSRRFQIQERLTMQIGDEINKALSPQGVGIRIVANHLCKKTLKYQDKSDELITTYFSGSFQTDNTIINQFWNNI